MEQKTILIAGSSGFLGSALIKALKANGHKLILLRRKHSSRKSSDPAAEYSDWDPYKNLLDDSAIERADIIINLSGENIAAGPWSRERRKKILDSRVLATSLLTSRILKFPNTRKILISASAIGFYGKSTKDIVDESSPPGFGFLANICEQWEGAASPLNDTVHRTIFCRFGLLLDPNGGMLKKMLLPFRLGLGAQLGDGQQHLSWISVEDATRGIMFCAESEQLSGPVNFVTPNPTTNHEFTKTLARVLNRPAFFRIPSFILKLAAGEMAEELLLADTTVLPKKLIAAGFSFNDRNLEDTLRKMLSC